MLKRIGLMLVLIAAMVMTTTAFAQGPNDVPLPATRTRISFVPGTSAYTFTANLTEGVSQGYILRVAARQAMFITKTGNASVQVLDPQDNLVVSASTAPGPWDFWTTGAGDYTVVLYGQGSVTLTVYIPPIGASPQPPVPLPLYSERIRFAPGGTGYSFTEDLVQGRPVAFLLGISAQQQLYVWTQGNVTLAVLDPQDNVLLPLMPLSAQWQFTIPQTGDYTLVLLGAGRTFISINIPPLSPTVPPDEPRRISFNPGGTSATIQGTTAMPGLDRFVIRALGGQTMSASISATQGPVILIIYGEDGNVLISDHAGASNWSGMLPATQDYFIDTRSFENAAVDFSLQVTIPALPTSAPLSPN